MILSKLYMIKNCRLDTDIGCWNKSERTCFSTETVRIFDHLLVKPKCVWEELVHFNFQNLFTFVKCLVKTHFGFTNTQRSQICAVSVLKPILFYFFKQSTLYIYLVLHLLLGKYCDVLYEHKCNLVTEDLKICSMIMVDYILCNVLFAIWSLL